MSIDSAPAATASVDQTERRPFSLEAQRERLAAYVATQPGWVLARSYSDRMSGKRLDRPGLQQALHDARTGRYELLLVFKVDRLARSTGGLAKVLEELDGAGSPSSPPPSRSTPLPPLAA
jgi:site-specific DNA recombinase